MYTENLERTFPTIDDYPEEIFDIRMPHSYRVGCTRAYLRANVIARRFFVKRIRLAFSLLPQQNYRLALDLGTGSGFYLPFLSGICKQVHGVDINHVLYLTNRMVVKKNLSNVKLYHADVTKLPFKSKTFDLLFSLSLIEHIPDQKIGLIEFDRVLKKEGIMILGYPLQNMAQEAFEGLNSIVQRTKLFILLPFSESVKKYKELKEFPHHHAPDFHNIKKIAQEIFVLKKAITIKLLGFPVYEILLLTH